MSLGNLLVHQVTVLRNSPTSDGQGGFTDNLQPIDTEVPCRVYSLSDRELVTIAQRFPKVQDMVYMEPWQDVQPGDVLQGTFEFTDWLRVANVKTPSKPGHHLEVYAERIAPVVVNAPG